MKNKNNVSRIGIPDNIKKAKILLYAIVYRGEIIDILKYPRNTKIGETLISGIWKPDLRLKGNRI